MVDMDNADIPAAGRHGTIEILWQMLDNHELPLRFIGVALGVVLLLILLTANLEVRLPGVHLPEGARSTLRPGQSLLAPGHHEINDPAISTTPDWFTQRLNREAALATNRPGGSLSTSFYGTDARLIARVGPEAGRVYIRVDGAPVSSLSRDDSGRSYINLKDADAINETIPVVSGLAHEEHMLTITNGSAGQLAISGIDIDAATPFPWAFALIYTVLVVVLIMVVREAVIVIARQFHWLPPTRGFILWRWTRRE